MAAPKLGIEDWVLRMSLQGYHSLFLKRLAATVLLAVSAAGCATIIQQNIGDCQPSCLDNESGIIVGSVTAPPVERYHSNVFFDYRSLDDGGKTEGVITASTPVRYVAPHPFVPWCQEGPLPDLCGRLFAIRLPAGRYQIDGPRQPLQFTVTPGKLFYVGNLHVEFCVGMATPYRGGILGSKTTLRDEFARDITLVREEFDALRSLPIEKSLWPDPGWVGRTDGEPPSWGNCSDEIRRGVPWGT